MRSVGRLHLPIEAEDGNAVHWVDEVGRLHHVVLLVAAQPVLGPEGRGQPDVAERRQGIEGMHEVARHGGGMGEQRHAPARRAACGAAAPRAGDRYQTSCELRGCWEARARARSRRGGGNPAARAGAAAPSMTACPPGPPLPCSKRCRSRAGSRRQSRGARSSAPRPAARAALRCAASASSGAAASAAGVMPCRYDSKRYAAHSPDGEKLSSR